MARHPSEDRVGAVPGENQALVCSGQRRDRLLQQRFFAAAKVLRQPDHSRQVGWQVL